MMLTLMEKGSNENIYIGLFANKQLEDTAWQAELGHWVPKVRVTLAPYEYATTPLGRVLTDCALSIIKTIKLTFNNN